MPILRNEATLDLTRWTAGIQRMQSDVNRLTSNPRTVQITARLAPGTAAAIQQTLQSVSGQIRVSVDASALPSQLQAVRTQLQGLHATFANLVRIDTSGLTAVKAQVDAQITQLTALIQQLRSLGGGGGGGGAGSRGGALNAGTRQLLADLEAVNNQYKRGQIDAAQYSAQLQALQTRLTAAAASATQGSADFRALDRSITQVTQGLRRVQTDNITKLRTELTGARAAFDAAAASATSFAQQRAAVAQYTQQLQTLRTNLTSLAQSGRLTTEQLGAVNRMLAQTAREMNTINGRVNIAGLSGNLTNALQQFAQFNPLAAQAVSLFGGLTTSAGGAALAFGATAAALGALTAGFIQAFRTAADFQQTLVDIKALTQPTTAELGELKDAAISIGKPFGVGAREAAGAILELNKAGLTASDTINGGLSGALALAGAAGIKAADGARIAAGAMTAFGLAADDIPRIADVFANFSNQTVLGADDLSQALASVGPVARESGLSIEQFAGIMATLAQGGFRSMSDAGTSLKTMLLALQAPSETAVAALDELKVSAFDSEGKIRPLGAVIEDLRKKMAGMADQKQRKYLKDIFGADAIRSGMILLREGTVRIDENTAAMGKQGEAARISQERMESFNGSMKNFNTAWETFAITVGEKALPLMTKIVDNLTEMVEGLNDFERVAATALGYIGPLAIAFGLLKFNISTIAWGGLITSLRTLPALFAAARTATLAFAASNPFGIVALATAGIVTYVNTVLDETRRIEDATHRNNLATSGMIQKKVDELRKAGGELNNARAALLLAIDLRGDAAMENDTERVKMYDENIARLKARINGLEAAQRGAAAASGELATQQTAVAQKAHLTDEQLKKQEATLKSVKDELGKRSDYTFATDFQNELKKINSDFANFKKRLEADVKDPIQLKIAVDDLNARKEAEIKAARAKFYADAKRDAAKGATEAWQAEINAMQEGSARRAEQYNFDVQQLQNSIDEQARRYADFPDVQARIRAAGNRRLIALRAEYDQKEADAQKQEVERARQVQQAIIADRQQAQAEDARVQLQQLERERDAALKAAGDNNAAKLKIELAYAGRISAARARVLQQQYDSEYKQLRDALDDRLRDERTTQQERVDLIRTFNQRAATLNQKYAEEGAKLRQEEVDRLRDLYRQAEEEAKRHAENLQNLQQDARDARHDAAMAGLDEEVAALDRRHQAEVGAAEGNARRILEIELQTARDRLRIQSERQDREYLNRRATLQEAANRELRDEKLTGGERAAIRARLAAELQALDQRYETDRRKLYADTADIIEEAAKREAEARQQAIEKVQALEKSVHALNGTLRSKESESAARAMRDFKDSARDAGQAARDAEPFLRKLASGQALTNKEVEKAPALIDTLVSKLQAQRNAVDQLIRKYEELKNQVSGIYGGVFELAQGSGDIDVLVALRNKTQQDLNQANAALRALAQGPVNPDTIQRFSEQFGKVLQLTKDLNTQFTAVGEAQAKVFEANGNQAGADQARTAAANAYKQAIAGVNDGMRLYLDFAKKAGVEVQKFGRDVQAAEDQAKSFEARLLSLDPSVIDATLRKQYAAAGQQLGDVFVNAFREELERLMRSPITIPVRVSASGAQNTPQAAAGGTTVQLYLNNQKAPLVPGEVIRIVRDGMQELLPAIRSEAASESRRNPERKC